MSNQVVSPLAAAIICMGTAAHAAQPGTQITVRDFIGPKGWTSIVPMDLNGDKLTDLLFYNKKTGRAEYSIATNAPGRQVIVKSLVAPTGWTALIPMNLNGDSLSPLLNLTDLLSYNATTGRTVLSTG